MFTHKIIDRYAAIGLNKLIAVLIVWAALLICATAAHGQNFEVSCPLGTTPVGSHVSFDTTTNLYRAWACQDNITGKVTMQADTYINLPAGTAWSTLALSGTNTGTGMVLAPTATGTIPFTLNCPSLLSVSCFSISEGSNFWNIDLNGNVNSFGSITAYTGGTFGPGFLTRFLINTHTTNTNASPPWSVEFPSINSNDTLPIWVILNDSGSTTCFSKARMDGDGFFVWYGTCSLAVQTTNTTFFGQLRITVNQQQTLTDFLIGGPGQVGAPRTGGAQMVDWYDDKAGTRFFFAPDAESLTNHPSWPLGQSTANIVATGTQSISGCSLTGAVGGAWAGAFNSGITGTCTVTITPGNTAPNGFFCTAKDLTTPADEPKQTGTLSTTTCTLSWTTVSGDLITWEAVAF